AQVRHHRVLDGPDAAFLDRRVAPGRKGMHGVDRDTDHFGATRLELLDLLVKGDDLGRAHERERERVEVKNDVLAAVFFKIERLGRAVGHDGLGLDGGCGSGSERAHVWSPWLFEFDCRVGEARPGGRAVMSRDEPTVRPRAPYLELE